MRVYTNRMNPPYTMIGQNVAKIIESKDPEYPKDSIVLTKSGWVKTGMWNLIQKHLYLTQLAGNTKSGHSSTFSNGTPCIFYVHS